VVETFLQSDHSAGGREGERPRAVGGASWKGPVSRTLPLLLYQKWGKGPFKKGIFRRGPTCNAVYFKQRTATGRIPRFWRNQEPITGGIVGLTLLYTSGLQGLTSGGQSWGERSGNGNLLLSRARHDPADRANPITYRQEKRPGEETIVPKSPPKGPTRAGRARYNVQLWGRVRKRGKKTRKRTVRILLVRVGGLINAKEHGEKSGELTPGAVYPRKNSPSCTPTSLPPRRTAGSPW